MSEPYRHYLAIIAAARHNCTYLVNLHEKKFLQARGDPKWLNGLDHIPAKLRAIYDINKILAHRPWLLNKEHIERLTKGSYNWSLSEVVHAIVLLAHFHSLSSFVFSCGLTQELDEGTTSSQKIYDSIFRNNSTSSSSNEANTNICRVEPAQQPVASSNLTNGITNNPPNSIVVETINKPVIVSQESNVPGKKIGVESGPKVEALVEKMKVLSQKTDECSETELSNRFKNVEMQAAELPVQITTDATSPPKPISQYIDDATFTYQDFTRRGAENVPTTFRVQDYSWDDHGLPLVSTLYNDVGELLHKKIQTAYELTYNTIAGNIQF